MAGGAAVGAGILAGALLAYPLSLGDHLPTALASLLGVGVGIDARLLQHLVGLPADSRRRFVRLGRLAFEYASAS
jgi:hypothetical protein